MEASGPLCAWGEAERGWGSGEGGIFGASLPGFQSLEGERGGRGKVILSGAREKGTHFGFAPLPAAISFILTFARRVAEPCKLMGTAAVAGPRDAQAGWV